jgi:hypothetical protein
LAAHAHSSSPSRFLVPVSDRKAAMMRRQTER